MTDNISMQPINEKLPPGNDPTLAYPPPEYSTQSQPVYPGQVPGRPGPQPYGSAVAPGQPPQPGYGGAPGIVSTNNNVTVVSQGQYNYFLYKCNNYNFSLFLIKNTII